MYTAIYKTRGTAAAFENSHHAALPPPRIHLVLGDPAQLPLSSRDAIAAACLDKSTPAASVLFMDPPDQLGPKRT